MSPPARTRKSDNDVVATRRDTGFILPLADALAHLPLPPTPRWPDGQFHREGLVTPGLSAGIFAPRGKDWQSTHPRDELYVVVAGDATLELDGTEHEVRLGDLIFVPAGVDHRFCRIGEGFATWVMFFDQTPEST